MLAITHTLSTALPASHSRASTAYLYIFRQYYLWVTASVSQVHVQYIKLDSKKKKKKKKKVYPVALRDYGHTICPRQTKRKNAFSHINANGCSSFFLCILTVTRVLQASGLRLQLCRWNR